MDKFVIGIPTINQKELLVEAVNKYVKDFPNTNIYIVDNGKQNIKFDFSNVYVFNQFVNIGVSDSWNLLANLTFYGIHAAENALILNDDVYLGKKESDILSVIDEGFDFSVSHGTWCSFLLPKKTFELVGDFDNQFFPAYFEDNDYHTRMKLHNLNYNVTEKLTPEIFRNSCTIKKDPSLNQNFDLNKQKYITKWGGEPGKEIFKTPYNA
jgi:GT2 family glycosyltransferase